MNSTSILSKLLLGMASLTLSTGMWAYSPVNTVTEPVTKTTQVATDSVWDWGMDNPMDPEYLVTDKDNNKIKYLDGVDKGQMVSDQGARHYNKDCMKGDTITNLQTKRSGVIKGVKDQGTMDVVAPSGKTVRYQYIIYKVKPVK